MGAPAVTAGGAVGADHPDGSKSTAHAPRPSAGAATAAVAGALEQVREEDRAVPVQLGQADGLLALPGRSGGQGRRVPVDPARAANFKQTIVQTATRCCIIGATPTVLSVFIKPKYTQSAPLTPV